MLAGLYENLLDPLIILVTVPLAMLDSAWKAAGQPRIAAIGEPLPDAMAEGVDATAAVVDPAGDPLLVLPPLDLRQGPYAATRPTAASAGRILALVAGIGVVAHAVYVREAIGLLDAAPTVGQAR
jgi:general secretion pathway protein L